MLAQQGQHLTGALVWTLVLIGAVIAGSVVVWIVRKRVFDESEADGGGGLSLHDLREMRDRGDLSEEEYERAKGAVLGGMGAKAGSGSPRTPSRSTGEERRAPAGFDLTGEPLPDFRDGGRRDGGEGPSG